MPMGMGIFDVFRKPKKEEPIDVVKDLKAIVEFLKGVNGRVKELSKMYKEYFELRKQYLHLKTAKASEKALRTNIVGQIKKYDKILKIFQVFELDTGIASERAKKIAKSLRIDAEKYKVNQKWLDLVRKDEKWTFDW